MPLQALAAWVPACRAIECAASRQTLRTIKGCASLQFITPSLEIQSSHFKPTISWCLEVSSDSASYTDSRLNVIAQVSNPHLSASEFAQASKLKVSRGPPGSLVSSRCTLVYSPVQLLGHKFRPHSKPRFEPALRSGSRTGFSPGLRARLSAGLSSASMAASQRKRSSVQTTKAEESTILRQLGWRPTNRPSPSPFLGNSIETPALVVDRDAMDANIAKLNELLSPYPNVRPRLHAKAHKAPQIALLQLEKHADAFGVCCQKLTEAEAMVAGGLRDVFVSNEIVGFAKLNRLAVLAKIARVAVCADASENVRDISKAAVAAGVTIQVLVEVNVGQNRCGVETPAEAVALAAEIASLPGLGFGGIQAYHGGIQHVRKRTERKAEVEKVVAKAREVVEALREGGLDCPVVTGGGTGTFEFEAASGVYTEVQPGSYLFGDADYARNEDNPWQQSLFIQTTVMSVNRYRGTAVIDAGLKASSFDSGPPLLCGRLGEHFDVQNGGDEHGVLVPKSGGRSGEELPKVGDIVRLVPGHCDPTVNCHDFLVGVRGGLVEEVWEVSGRGPGY